MQMISSGAIAIPNGIHRKWKWLGVLILLVTGLLYWWHINPLPSDQAMIGRFNTHRPEIESLVKSYREFVPKEGMRVWEHLPENKIRMQMAGVKRVKELATTWFPNPYSIEAAKAFEEKKKNAANVLDFIRPHKTIGIELVDDKRPEKHFGWVLISSGPQLIFKELVYFPEIPKIENNILLMPASTSVSSNAPWPSPYRVYSSLDDYPPASE